MIDKTSTAPVMSLQQVHDVLHSSGVSTRGKYETIDREDLRDMAEAIKPYLNIPTPDVVGGDVVACRYRVVAPNGNVGKWFFTDEASVSSDCLEVQPLYAAPRVQGDADGTLRAACQRFRAAELAWKAARSEHGEASKEIDSAFCVRGDRLDVAEKALRTAVAAKHEAKRSLFAALAAQPKGDISHPAEQTRGDGAACGRCGASSEAEASTRCIPDGDSCPVCDEPIASTWERGTRGDGVDAVSYAIEAVAEVVRDADGQNKLSFVVEGAEASLELGTLLYTIPFMTPPDDGSVELFDAPRQAAPDGVAIGIQELIVMAKKRAAEDAAHSYTKAPDFLPHAWVCLAMRDAYEAGRQAMLAAAPSAGRMGVES